MEKANKEWAHRQATSLLTKNMQPDWNRIQVAVTSRNSFPAFDPLHQDCACNPSGQFVQNTGMTLSQQSDRINPSLI
jgi:hypothetical protein